jgi:hypothetical protein
LWRFTLKKAVDPFISIRAVSQFWDKRIKVASYRINPVVLTESFGAFRGLIKKERTTWDARLGGALRQSFERNKMVMVQENSAIEDLRVISDGGIELVTELKIINVPKNITFTTQLKLYEALFSSNTDAIKGTTKKNYWRYPDINWENTLEVNITKYIMLNLYAQLLYDREIDQDVGLKETLGIGLTFNFKKNY